MTRLLFVVCLLGSCFGPGLAETGGCASGSGDCQGQDSSVLLQARIDVEHAQATAKAEDEATSPSSCSGCLVKKKKKEKCVTTWNQNKCTKKGGTWGGQDSSSSSSASSKSSSSSSSQVSTNRCTPKSEKDCNADSGCGWTGSSCSDEPCSKYTTPNYFHEWSGSWKAYEKLEKANKKSCNKLKYCIWNKPRKECRSSWDHIYIGGGKSQQGSKDPDNIESSLVASSLATRERYTGSAWEPCAEGDDGCFFGDGTHAHGGGQWNFLNSRSPRWGVELPSKYSKAAVDLQITCSDQHQTLTVKYWDSYNSNVKLRVWYNRKEYTYWKSETTDSNLYVEGNMAIKTATIHVSSSDGYPVLRVEASKSGSGSARAAVEVAIHDAKAYFESCMTATTQHDQCLEKISDVKTTLRTSHKDQLTCLTGSASEQGDIPGCVSWHTCLSDSSKDVIVSVITAFDGVSGGNLLEGGDSDSGDEKAAPKWKASDGGCKDSEHPTCEDPSRLDIEAFDCNCFEAVIGKTPAQIKSLVCPKEYSAVCCSWKNKHCQDYPATLLEERAQGKNVSGGASLAELTAVEESLSGKRTCGASKR